ncbi:MAG: hypothetical protein JSS49_28615 [Planctomycetes bacterium]|nr:hypothetical protein [Planctomycetota bacterium]
MRPLPPDGLVEHIQWHNQHIATLIRSEFSPESTTFVTPDSYYQQAGFVVYPRGGSVQTHTHLPLQRHLVGTPETLIVLRGSAEVDLYGLDKSFMGTWNLRRLDILLLVSGGHGLRFLEDTTLLEIKQGPYTGLAEKEPLR